MTTADIMKVYENPKKLEIRTFHEERGLRYEIYVKNGHPQNHRLLITTQPLANSKAEVISDIKKTLRGLIDKAAQKLRKGLPPSPKVLKPDGAGNEVVDPNKVLSRELVDQIGLALEKSDTVLTKELLKKLRRK